jgi:hypothetical protein
MNELSRSELICLRIVGELITSFALMQLFGLPAYYRSEVAFESKAIYVPGTVIETTELKTYSSTIGGIPKSSTDYFSTVEFQTQQGKSVKFKTISICSIQWDCAKKNVRVQYDPKSPNKARIDRYYITPEFTTGLLGVIYLIFLSIGIWTIFIYPGNRTNLS